MVLKFPEKFFFGTSTSAYQTETAFDHDWAGLTAKDGRTFHRTTDHEKRLAEDAGIINSLAPNYRFSLMWSKLQREPYASLDVNAKREYLKFIHDLRSKRITLMMVIHHWGNPLWFAQSGGWLNDESVSQWTDYARKIVDEFGDYIDLWNTFNEPNLYVTFSFLLGKFPPFKKNPANAIKAARNMGAAHGAIYQYIKKRFPDKLVGVSHNCAVFTAQNMLGELPARLARLWYTSVLPGFFEQSDFTGISYYARIRFDPFPITNLYTPGKLHALENPCDDIWEYYPEGLRRCVNHFWERNRKPIIITENGICTNDDTKRVKALKDYMSVIHRALHQKIPILGYYHWSAWDNFEWTLGMDFRFGLFEVDPDTCKRTPKPSANVYRRLAYEREIEI